MIIYAVFEDDMEAGNVYDVRLDSGAYKVALASGVLHDVGSLTYIRIMYPSPGLVNRLNRDEYTTLVETVLKVDRGELVAYPVEVI